MVWKKYSFHITLWWKWNVGHVFTKNVFFKRNASSKIEINYMAYLSDILRSCTSKETGVSSF